MYYVIDGQALAEKIKDEIIKEIIGAKKGLDIYSCPRPNLAIILIGERDDSELYVNLKEKEAKKVGIDTHIYKCAEDVSEKEVLDLINFLNKDDTIDAILIQLPLPVNLDTDKIIMAVSPEKDVDGFHPENLKRLLGAGSHSCACCHHCEEGIMPPVYAVVFEMLKSINYDLKNKRTVILANSETFGKNLMNLLVEKGAQVEIIRPDDKKLETKTKEADLLITAVGRSEFIKREMIKKNSVIIDIGITKKGKKVVGDVDFNDVKDRAGYISPVPGGVGPMTIAMALKNTLEMHKRRCGS